MDLSDICYDGTGNEMLRRLNEFGSRMAGRTADLAGSPLSIVLVAIFCAGWFFRAGPAGENTLTLILSVASITLTQMVLNGQRRSEKALHLKMDEIVIALDGARNEVAGIESKSIDHIEALRQTSDIAGGPDPTSS
ncbi:low affinity iron permease family protein [Sphingomonas sp. GB1N7]|uniref:low affinity iron permease family protein n=1 Tax=Parasphingomonas caseinilytica TaxID=3096158 RepID=UPI002FCA5EDC